MKLFITATDVPGPAVVTFFKNSAVTPDVLLASACLPTMFQAIEIDGEPFWDRRIFWQSHDHASRSENPAERIPVLFVEINPVERERAAALRLDILNRLNEVSVNAVLLKELRMIALLRQVADPGNSEGALWAGMRIHRIASEMLTELGASSKLNAEWEFFSLLRDEGRRSAQVFLESHTSDLRTRSTWILTSCRTDLRTKRQPNVVAHIAVWFEPFRSLKSSKISTCAATRSNGPTGTFTHWDWVISHVYIVYLMQAIVAAQIENFKKFRPAKSRRRQLGRRNQNAGGCRRRGEPLTAPEHL